MAGKQTFMGVFKKNAEQAFTLGVGCGYGAALFNAMAGINEAALATGIGTGVTTAAIFVVGKYLQNKPQ